MTRYLYTSREHDSDTGLQYNRARWYDGSVGRWASEDPAGFNIGDASLARYVSNVPTNLVDPSGLSQTFTEDYGQFSSEAAAYDVWLSSEQGSGSGSGNAFRRMINYELNTWRSMILHPIATVGGWYQGIGHGWAMVGNAATFNQIDPLNEYVDHLIQQNGGVYGAANVSAQIGVSAAYTLAFAVAAEAAIATTVPVTFPWITTSGSLAINGGAIKIGATFTITTVTTQLTVAELLGISGIGVIYAMGGDPGGPQEDPIPKRDPYDPELSRKIKEAQKEARELFQEGKKKKWSDAFMQEILD